MIRDWESGDPLIVAIALPTAGGVDSFHASRRLAQWSVWRFLRMRRRWRSESYRQHLATREPDCQPIDPRWRAS